MSLTEALANDAALGDTVIRIVRTCLVCRDRIFDLDDPAAIAVRASDTWTAYIHRACAPLAHEED